MKINESNVEMSTMELLFLISLVQENCLRGVYFGLRYAHAPVLSALNRVNETYAKVRTVISPDQADQIIDLVFDKLNTLDELIGVL